MSKTKTILPTVAARKIATTAIAPLMSALVAAEQDKARADETVTRAVAAVGSVLSVEQSKYGKDGAKAFVKWAMSATKRSQAFVYRAIQVANVAEGTPGVLDRVPSYDAVSRFSSLTGEETETVLKSLAKAKARGTDAEVKAAVATVKASREGAESEQAKHDRRVKALAKRLKTDTDRRFRPYAKDKAALTAALNLAAWAAEQGAKYGPLTPEAIRACGTTALKDLNTKTKTK